MFTTSLCVAQRLLGKLRKGKALKDIKLVDGLLKYKQSRVCVPQGKLRLLELKEEHDSLFVGHLGEKKHHIGGVKEVLLAMHEK